MRNRSYNILFPLLIFFFLCGLTFIQWGQHVEYDRETTRRRMQGAVEQVRMRLQYFMDERMSSLDLLAGRLVERRPPDFSYGRYRQFAESYYRHYPGFKAINWIDTQGVVRWVYPERENYSAKGKNLCEHPQMTIRESFRQAGKNRIHVLSPCATMSPGVIGFQGYWPLIYDGQVRGYLVGEFDVRSIVETRLDKAFLSEYLLTIHEGTGIIYQRKGENLHELSDNSLRAKCDLVFRDKTWHLKVEPLVTKSDDISSLRSAWHSPQHPAFLSFGLALSAGLSFLLYALMRRIELYRAACDQGLQEISVREQAEKALREADTQRETLIATIPDIVVQIAPNGIRTWCNNAAYAFFGDDVIGKKGEYYFVGEQDTRQRVQSILDGTNEAVHIESWQRRRDGEPRLLDWRCRRLLNDEGMVIGAICSARDITDEKRLQKEREALLKELSEKSAELESFVYTVSHDLKTPIVTVEGFVGALREDFGEVLGTEGERYLRRISEATCKMEALINDLIELSRIGRTSENKVEIPFEDLVRDALRTLYPQIKAKGIAVHVPENMACLYGERKRLGQVVDNLMSNAVKYVGRDNPSPRIEAGAERQGNETICFVKDNGIGIDKVYFDKIFKIFHRLPAARNIEGTGMGLTIVKRIVELHGGRVWVESEPGKGSTFYFTVSNKED